MKPHKLIIIGLVLLLACFTLPVDARVVRDENIGPIVGLKQAKTIGERIQILRIHHGYTQEELAERLDTSRGYIAQIEMDYINLSSSWISVLAREFNINRWILLTGFSENEALLEENLINRISLVNLALWGESAIIGKRLKLAMVVSGVDKGELAERLNSSYDCIFCWENGRKEIPADKITQLASILNINPELLMLTKTNIPYNVKQQIESIGPVGFIGSRIMQRREELGWSKGYLSSLIEINPHRIADWEDGYLNIAPRNIPKIAEALDVNVWILLTGKTKEEALKKKNLFPLIPPIEAEKWKEKRIIGQRIKLARYVKGYSQRVLTDRLAEKGINMSTTILSHYERGINLIPDEIIPILAEVLDLKFSYLKP